MASRKEGPTHTERTGENIICTTVGPTTVLLAFGESQICNFGHLPPHY